MNHRTVRILTFLGITLLSLFFIFRSALAALGWVGNMSPTGGSTSTITVGGSFTVYVQVYKAGVTEAPGQGAGITCTLHLGTVGYFGGTWANTTDTAMIFNTQVGNNDEYKATISPGVGLYEFTAFCTDTTDNTQYWQGSGNGRLVVDAPSGSCNSASQNNNNLYWNGLGHDSFSTSYRNPISAVTNSQGTVRLVFRTCMDDLNQAPRIRVYNDRTNSETESYTLMDFLSHGADASLGGVTYWKKDITIPTSPTILYYIFKATDSSTSVYYRDDDPAFYGGGWGSGESDQNTAQNKSYQITVYDSSFATPSWLKNAVIYHIFPERFRNGDSTNDPVNGGDWIYGQTVRKLSWNQALCDPRGLTCPNEYSNQFYGGDLQGVIDNLDYLQQLGVTTIYLNPIFEAPSNHLYDTQDYLLIDPYFGNLASFQTLTAEAQARGIQIILDGVFNHVSSDSKYFDRYQRWDAAGNLTSPSGPGSNDQSGACESTLSGWRSWFTFFTGTGKCYDGTPGNLTMNYWDWAGYDSLAKLVSSNANVRNYIYNSGSGSVGRYWLAQGADGWRFDVGGDVDTGTGTGDSNGFWSGFRSAARTQSSEAALLGEEWGDASAWLVGDQWDSVMNYRFRSATLSWLFDSCQGNGCTGGTKFQENDSNDNSSSGSIVPLTVSQFDQRLASIREDYPPQAWQSMMNLVDSHDTNRIRFLLKKISNEDANAALNKVKFLGIFQFTYPGAPALYYGNEAGLAPEGVWDGSTWQDDPYNRAVYPWTDQGYTVDASLLEHYQKLAVLRNHYPVLRTGDFTPLLIDNSNKLYAYLRSTGVSDLALVVLNRNAASAQTVSITGIPTGFNGTTLVDVLRCTGNPVVCPSYTVSGGAISNIQINTLWGAILVKGPLPPYQVSLTSANPNLAAGQSTAVVATVIDLGGQLVPDGTVVTFTRLSGSGSLSSATATVSGGNGQAMVTYNAPGSGRTVATLRAQAGSYAFARAATAVYVGYSAPTALQATSHLTIGPAVLDASSTVGVKLIKSGLGEPTATVANYTGNPVSVTGSYTTPPDTAYVDVHLDQTSGVIQLEIRVKCLTSCDPNAFLWWWDAVNLNWTPFDSSGVSGSEVWGIVTTSTSPSLTDLTGTPLVGAPISPTAVEVTDLEAISLAGHLQVQWQTFSEVSLAGFNLYRSDPLTGGRQQVNAALIKAKFPGTLRGASYAWTDATAVPGVAYSYWLEVVGNTGHASLLEPIQVTAPYPLYLPAVRR